MTNFVSQLWISHPYLTGVVGGYAGLYGVYNYVLPWLKRRPNGLGSTSTGENVLGSIGKSKIGKGKVALVTGANVGLGRETVRVLALAGVKVIMAGRDMKKMEDAKKWILSQVSDADLELLELDLGNQKQIHQCVANFAKRSLSLDIMILNAGYMSPVRETTVDGFECSIGINHLGHFSFCLLMLPYMLKTSTDEKRIVVLGSGLHRFGTGKINWDDFQMEKTYSSMQPTYAQSKLANLMFTRELNKRLAVDKVPITVNCVMPGIIHTELHRKDHGWFTFLDFLMTPLMSLVRKTVSQGVATTIYAALHPELKGKGGLYLENCGVSVNLPYADIEEEWARLWKLSEDLTNVSLKYKE